VLFAQWFVLILMPFNVEKTDVFLQQKTLSRPALMGVLVNSFI
jgi:hypothetical protein